jgi:xanthine dehydrogenase small subunit
MAISAIDGNICRCTGYKSIERAALFVLEEEMRRRGEAEIIEFAVENEIVPAYFAAIKSRLKSLKSEISNLKSDIQNPKFLAGGTDLYVQKPDELVYTDAENLFDNSDLRFINETDEFVEVGASVVVTDLLESEIFNRIFPNLYKHLKLVSSTPIRNMATLAGNFVNASPIGDMTAWFLALDAEISVRTASGSDRLILLREFFLGYKQLAKSDDEFITKIRLRKDFTHFNFEKVCKRTFLDIASVNTAISLKVSENVIKQAHVSAGGVAPIPLYLKKTSEFLSDKENSKKTITEASEILQTEIAPISDVRGTAEYKRLLARQLFTAHFVKLFEFEN